MTTEEVEPSQREINNSGNLRLKSEHTNRSKDVKADRHLVHAAQTGTSLTSQADKNRAVQNCKHSDLPSHQPQHQTIGDTHTVKNGRTTTVHALAEEKPDGK
jgi:hypothetical protein